MLLGELHTSAELFFCFLSFFSEKQERQTERERRLVPETVVVPCDWWKPVARLMSVLGELSASSPLHTDRSGLN